MEYKNFNQIIEEIVDSGYKASVAVPSAANPSVIASVAAAVKLGFVHPVLIGRSERILGLLQEGGYRAEDYQIVEPREGQSDMEAAIELVKNGTAQIIMKGMLETSDFLRPIVQKENGLHTGGVMSHMALFELPGYHKLIGITDSGMVVHGDVRTKKKIILNACHALRAMGYEEPKFAILCCKEKVDMKIAETSEADALVQAWKRGELGRCSVAGPVSYDIAMSKKIAEVKQYQEPNIGNFDMFVVPDIHSGNMLGKSWTVTVGAEMAGVILGAKIPIVMTSRGSSAREKLNSLAVAAKIAMGQAKPNMQEEQILVINPGSTSTKVAVYHGETLFNEINIEHPLKELKKCSNINDQLEFRKQAVVKYLKDNEINSSDLSAIAARGGVVGELETGAYFINEDFVRQSFHSKAPHPANLAPVIAYELAKEAGIPAYVYDAVCGCGVPERMYTITGLPEIQRPFLTHVLNCRAVSIAQAHKDGIRLEEAVYIVAHLGGGFTVNLVYHGKILDFVGDDEGGFSPERSGGLPVRALVKLCYSGKYTEEEMQLKLKGKGGVLGYLGTNDIRQVEERIAQGDDHAKLIFESMALQVSRDIVSLAADVLGRVDKIILTGGAAKSTSFTQMVSERVSFLAPVVAAPGSFEMEALAYGVLRVIRGEETARLLS